IRLLAPRHAQPLQDSHQRRARFAACRAHNRTCNSRQVTDVLHERAEHLAPVAGTAGYWSNEVGSVGQARHTRESPSRLVIPAIAGIHLLPTSFLLSSHSEI